MSNINEEYSLNRTYVKYEDKIGILLKTVGNFLKSDLETKLANDLDMSIDCYKSNVQAFGTASAWNTIFSKDFGREYDYKMPFFVTGSQSEEKNKKAVTDVIKWAKNKNVIEKYLANIRNKCDYILYIKFLEVGESKKFNKMIIEDYKIDLKDENNKEFFKYIREDIRNEGAHSNNSSIKNYSVMRENADKVLKLASMFFNTENNKTRMAHIQKKYDAVMEIVNSKPIPLDEILKNYPVFESEDDVIGAFDIDYDTENHYLYANSLKMVEKEASTISQASKNIQEKAKEEVKVSLIKKERISVVDKNIVKDEIKSLLSYKGQITLNQITEIGKKINVLIDGGAFEGSKLFENDDENNRDFLFENVLKPLERIKRYAIINYSSRIALNREYYKTTDKEEKHRAKKTRDAIHYFVERDGLRYSPSCGVVYKSGIYETIKTIEKNPEKRFFIIVNSAKDANLIEDNDYDNVLVARIIGFGNDKQLRLTNKSLTHVDTFARYDFLDFGDEEVEEAKETKQPSQNNQVEDNDKVLDNKEPKKVNTEKASKIKKEDNSSAQTKTKDPKTSKETTTKPTTQNPNMLPAIASIPCIPDNNEMIDVNVLPKEGDTLLTSTKNTITLGRMLGEGGEGSVYEINNDLVAKIYHKNRLTKNRFDKLKLMIKCGFKSKRICFPLELLFNSNNQFVGYTMKKAPSNYMNLGESILQLNNKNALEKYTDLKKWDRHALTAFCAKLADVFVSLHENNILMGDINANNILVDVKDTSGASLLIVDTDSFQIGPYPCPVGTPVFTSPEIYKRTNEQYPRYGDFLRTLEDEQYAVASLLFQVLFLGQTPYAGKGVTGEGIEALKNYNFDYRGENSTGADVPDGPFRMIWQNIGFVLKRMFEEVFTGKKTYSAIEWEKALATHAKNIKSGKADNNLKPYRYPALPFMKEFVCEKCQRQANLPDTQYDRKVMFKELLLCKECDQDWLRTVKEKTTIDTCSKCGMPFDATIYDSLRAKLKGYQLKCPNCDGEVQTKCHVCGTPITIPRFKYNNPKYHNRFRCADCLTEFNISKALKDEGYCFDRDDKEKIRKKILEEIENLKKKLKRKPLGEEIEEIIKKTIHKEIFGTSLSDEYDEDFDKYLESLDEEYGENDDYDNEDEDEDDDE